MSRYRIRQNDSYPNGGYGYAKAVDCWGNSWYRDYSVGRDIDWSWYSTRHMIFKTMYETMVDSVTNTGGHPFNYCEHFHAIPAVLEKDTAPCTWFNNYGWGWDQTSYWCQGATFTVIPDLGFCQALATGALDSSNVVSLVEALARDVKGLINSKSLLAVTIKELPETIEMVRNPFGLLKHGWRLIAGKSTAAQLARKGSNLWLEYQYGWKSSYYDLKTFASSFHKYSTSLRQYREGVPRRYAERAHPTIPAPDPTVSDGDWLTLTNQVKNNSSLGFVPIRLVFDQPVVLVSLGCRALDNLSNQVSKLEKFCSSLGLTPDRILETLWEALPYSFVVDWFVNTDAIIKSSRYDSALADIQKAHVSHLGFSTKVECSYAIQGLLDVKAPSFSWYWGNRPSSRPVLYEGTKGRFKYYRRMAGIPAASYQLLDTSGLKLSQGVSGFALIFQRFLGR